MHVPLQMVGVHRNANINIKGVQFTNGKGVATGADELVGNLCRYLEIYGAYPLHVAERKQAILDGEGDLLGVRAARRKMEKADEMKSEARAQILKAEEAVEARLQQEANEEREAAAAASLAALERKEIAEKNAKAINGEMEDQSDAEGRGSEQTSGGKGSKSNKRSNG
jgi:hypothetical protein